MKCKFSKASAGNLGTFIFLHFFMFQAIFVIGVLKTRGRERWNILRNLKV